MYQYNSLIACWGKPPCSFRARRAISQSHPAISVAFYRGTAISPSAPVPCKIMVRLRLILRKIIIQVQITLRKKQVFVLELPDLDARQHPRVFQSCFSLMCSVKRDSKSTLQCYGLSVGFDCRFGGQSGRVNCTRRAQRPIFSSDTVPRKPPCAPSGS